MGQCDAMKNCPLQNADSTTCENWQTCGEEKDFFSTLLFIVIRGLQVKMTKDRLMEEKWFTCMHKGTNKGSG